MAITDLAGVSKPMCKLIDVFQNSCSWVLKPLQIKRIAAATSKASSIQSNDEFKKGLKQSLLEYTINALHSAREKRQFENVASIYASAAQELQMIDSVDDTPVNQDWAARFFDYAKDISNDEARIVWGKILAGEVAKPGSFFKRTLSILQDIETFEAEWFRDFCQFVIDDAYVPKPLIDKYYPVNQLQSLIDCGLINGVDVSFLHTADTTEISSKTLLIKPACSATFNTEIRIEAFTLTDAGIQLYKITQCQTNYTYMEKYKEIIEQWCSLQLEIIPNT